MFRKTLLITTLIAVIFPATADDWQTWDSFSMKGKLNDSWSWHLAQEYRIKNNMQVLGYMHADVGVIYKINENWAIEPKFRQVISGSLTSMKPEYIPTFDVFWKWQISPIVMNTRFEIEYKLPEGAKSDPIFRINPGISWPLDISSLKLEPYISAEPFIKLRDMEYYRLRSFAGFKISAKTYSKFALRIFYMQESTETAKGTTNVNSLGSVFDFNF